MKIGDCIWPLKNNKNLHMKIEQIYTGCLAQGAYYIVSNGEAAIIDPLREVQPYLDRLNKDKVKLKYIFETHFHADFVSGHLDLSKKTGVPIVYGPTATPAFDAIIAEDNQIFEVGNIKIKVLHTPGHTMESSTYLLIDENGKDIAIFSGDTLFLGDVGRPDLAQKAANLTQEELAALVNLSPTHVSVIERGLKVTKLDTFIAIANALDVSADTLLIDVVAHSVTGVTNELTEKIEKLPIKEQKKIIKVIHTLLEE